MEQDKKSESRRHTRLEADFAISYRVRKEVEGDEYTHTRNISKGGLLLTTHKKFHPGTILEMTIWMFPIHSEEMEFTGIVVDSEEVVPNIIYETRIKFINAAGDEINHQEIFSEYVNKYSESNDSNKK